MGAKEYKWAQSSNNTTLLSKNVNCSSFDSVHEPWTSLISEQSAIIGQSPNWYDIREHTHQINCCIKCKDWNYKKRKPILSELFLWEAEWVY